MNRATTLQVFSTILILLLFIPHRMQAQGEVVNTLAECHRLTEKGKNFAARGDNAIALEYLTRAELIAKKNNRARELIKIKNEIGKSYAAMSNFGDAMSYYMQALSFAKKDPAMEDYSLWIMNNIGVLYHTENEVDMALKYYRQAYTVAASKNYQDLKTTLALNIADIYNSQRNFKEAKKYLLAVKNEPAKEKFKIAWKINYAESIFLENNIQEAEIMLNKILRNINIDTEVDSYVATTLLLSRIADKKNYTSSAIDFAKKGLHKTPILSDQVIIYDQLSMLEIKQGNYKDALKYKDSARIIEDSISSVMKRGLYESNKVKLKIQEYQNESKLFREKQQAERTIFIIGIIFSIITSLFIYRTLKNRITKQKQEKVIADNQQKIIALELEKRNLELEKRNNENLLLEQQMREKETNAMLEQERLKNEIDARNRKLSAKALNLSGRNELIEDIIDSFSQNAKLRNDPALSRYIRDLKKLLKTDDEWDNFIIHFEEANNHMLKRIHTQHPSLTSNDLRFIAYLYMNLSYKEIAVIFNITPVACGKRKERIAAKMNIPKNISIYSYISSI
jgi:hypothetical protein